MWYNVYKGCVPRVYDELVDYQKQLHKFNGNCYTGYVAREEAVAKWRNHRWKKN
jgi:hypothetical protein